MASVRVGIAGATGYGGRELLRLAARHRKLEITAAMASSSSAGATLPALTGIWAGEVVPLSVDQLASETDAVFLALPEAASAEIAPALVEHGVRVFDVSGAFRLREAGLRQRWYPDTPELDTPAVYGLTERRRDEIKGARFVACPGCYPTAALLALDPLCEAGVDPRTALLPARH